MPRARARISGNARWVRYSRPGNADRVFVAPPGNGLALEIGDPGFRVRTVYSGLGSSDSGSGSGQPILCAHSDSLLDIVRREHRLAMRMEKKRKRDDLG